jgi:hypothetical protein
MFKSTFAILTVVGTLLATAGPAGAAITYNGHAGLGSSVYQHNQTDLEFVALPPDGPGLLDITDGTSNTMFFGVAADGRGADYVAMPDMGGQYYSAAMLRT